MKKTNKENNIVNTVINVGKLCLFGIGENIKSELFTKKTDEEKNYENKQRNEKILKSLDTFKPIKDKNGYYDIKQTAIEYEKFFKEHIGKTILPIINPKKLISNMIFENNRKENKDITNGIYKGKQYKSPLEAEITRLVTNA